MMRVCVTFASRFLLILAILSLVSCKSPESRVVKTKLVVWGLQFGEETVGIRAKVKAFEQLHPDVEVSVLSMGAGTMNPQKLMTAIVGNVPPDVIHQDRFTIGDWASREAFIPLDELITRDRNSADGIRKEEFYPACWEEASYEGKVFAIPYTTDDRLLFYNRALFREAGLDPDKPPATWEELKVFTEKLTKRTPDGKFYERIGFIPNYGNSWLYLFSWQNGGEFMSRDGYTCTLDTPANVAALQFMVDIYDKLGGVDLVNRFISGFQTNDLDPFLTGKVAMKVDGNWVLNSIARFGPDLDFAVAPAPVPQERLDQLAGRKPLEPRFQGQKPYVTWSGGYSLAIPRGAAHPGLAWEFIKWMNLPDAARIESAAQKTYNREHDRVYVPNLLANRRVNASVFAEFAPENPRYRAALKQFTDMIENAKFRPVTFVGQRLWDEHVRAFELATGHEKSGVSPQTALTEGQRAVQVELDRVHRRGEHPLLDMRYAWACGAIVFAGLALFIGHRLRIVFRMGDLAKREALAGYLFASPWLIGFVALLFGPILATVFLGFCDYDVLHPPRFVGLGNYREILGVDRYYLTKALGNVAYLCVIGIPLGIFTGLSVALLLNNKVRGMTAYRTAFYVPSIVPVVASAALWAWILNGDPDRGIVNAIWKSTFTDWMGIAPPGWLQTPDWAKPGFIMQGMWGAGSGMILWLAGLQGIPQHLNEAAELDGAGPLHRFRHVTLPMLSPYIFYNVVMGVINTIQEFDRIYILAGQGLGGSSYGPVDSMLVPVLFLFNSAFKYFKMGYACALAWCLFLLILLLTLIQWKLAPRWVHYESEKS